MADYKIQLGVQLDSKAQENLKKQLQNIEATVSNVSLDSKVVKNIQDQLNASNFKINIDNSNINQAIKQLDSLSKKISGFKSTKLTTNNDNFLADKEKSLANVRKFINENTKAAKEFDAELKKVYSDLEATSNSKELTTINKQYQALLAQIKEVNANVNKEQFDANKTKAIADMKTYINENTKAAKEFGNAMNEALSKIEKADNPFDLTTANKQASALKAQIKASGLNGKIVETSSLVDTKAQANFLANQQKILAQNEKWINQNSAAVKEYKEQWDSCYESIKKANSDAELNTANKQINALKAQITSVGKNYNETNFLADKQKEIANLKKYINENTKAANQFGEALSESLSKLGKVSNPQELTTARKQIQSLKAEISAAGQSGLSFGDKIKSEISNLTSFFSATSIILSSVSHLKNGFSELVALDDAMVELKKVTDETSETYKNFYYQANEIAKQLGATTEEIITQTSNWAQLGLKG